MWDRLDQIDWKSLGYHVYGNNDAIPEQIRCLLSDDPELREAARDFLLGGGQDFGDIYDTTPAILPFLFEYLAHPDLPDRVALIYHLSGVAVYRLYARHLSIHMMRLCLQTYDAFKAALPSLFSLLHDELAEVRIAAAHLLQYLTDEVDTLIPQLCEHLKTEQDETVQLALLTTLKVLLKSLEWPRYQLMEEYRPFFNSIVERHTSHKIRVAAARAAIETLHPLFYDRDLPLSSMVPTLLIQEFLDHVMNANQHRDTLRYYHDLQDLVKDLAMMPSGPLLTLLKNPVVKEVEAHIIARGLLAHSLLDRASMAAHWEQFPHHEK